mmetsp:Transcript_19713/g.30971  ORF Transcript_19713/g.30971 Transcript_19713/m.30971 type:complete len:403 (+) Transcript_19713:96-1304(+)
MAISYEEALSTLQAMFSDQGYASHQLDAVLRHFGGHMEHTVETLLSHGEGTPDELIAKLSSLPASGGSGSGVAANSGGGGGGGGNSSFDADEELARQLQAEDEQQQQRQQQQQRGRSRQRGANQPSSGLGMGSALGNFPGQSRRVAASTVTAPKPTRLQPPPGTKGRGAPTVLPYDFLRIPGKKYPSTSATTTTTTATSSDSISDPIASANGPGGVGQMMSDEQLARMLQDELFQEELRNNPEFSHLAGRRNPSARSTVTGGGNRVAATRSGQTTGRSHRGGAATGGGVGWGERTDFFDRLSDLGDNAKRRFQHFASSWNDPNAQTNRRPLFGGGGVGGGQTTTNRGNESRGLLSNDLNMDDDEEEMDFVGGATGGSRDFEMNDVGSGSGAKINWSGDKKID